MLKNKVFFARIERILRKVCGQGLSCDKKEDLTGPIRLIPIFCSIKLLQTEVIQQGTKNMTNIVEFKLTMFVRRVILFKHSNPL